MEKIVRGMTILFVGLLSLASSVYAQVPAPGPQPTAPAESAENPLHLSIHHVTMGVASIDRERTFYHDVLGFQIGPFNKRPNYGHQQMLIPGFCIDMIEYKGSTRPTSTMDLDKQGLLHVALTIPNAAEVYEQLKTEGVSVAPRRVEKGRIVSVFVTDPEGNRLELTE
ncbi:VOC family protein [Paraburkholderia sp.]|uniref:VOC family protein n=1 Tax=Paraburkholderia sp. TaxID=1926495 RepID=UPI002395A3BC|nr:VOC family protein [Paraburkholderia sp.]MDE1182596.1 VOC family protein [Paraburkholderia sp.]